MTTSGPPQSGLRRFRDRVSRYLERSEPRPPTAPEVRSRTSADGDGPSRSPQGVRNPVWSVVLIVMIGLTGWAVSTVSIWLVPVYLGIMVLLLGSPQEPRPAGSDSDSGIERAGSAPTSLNAEEEASGQASGAATSGPKGAEPRAAKPKTSRSRSRKSAAKGGAEASPALAPASWIRIGPGKFVRADAEPGALVDASTDVVGAGRVEPDAGPQPPLLTDSELISESETEPGCQGIAPSALGSLATSEPATNPVPTAEMAADVPTDLVADVDRVVQPDEAVGAESEVDHDARALGNEDSSVEAVLESLVDDRNDAHVPEPENRPDDDLLPDRPIPAEDPCASGAAEAEPATDEDDREVEQSPLVSEARPDSRLDSRHVPSHRTAPSGPLSSRQRPRRAVRGRDAVDNVRRSRFGVPGSGPRDDASGSRNRLRDAARRTTGRPRRIRRGYRPRSPPARCGVRSPSSNRIA